MSKYDRMITLNKQASEAKVERLCQQLHGLQEENETLKKENEKLRKALNKKTLM